MPIIEFPPQSISEWLADKLEAAILKGEFAPGDRLVQTSIAEMYNVSRVPVRDALAIVEQRELLERLPRKGVCVRRVDRKEVHDLFELRELLECFAFGQSAPNLSAGDIDQAEEILEKEKEAATSGDFIGQLELDEAFHRLLWSRCANRQVKLRLDQLWLSIRMIRVVNHTKGFSEESFERHKQILEYLRSGRVDEACSTLRSGIVNFKEQS